MAIKASRFKSKEWGCSRKKLVAAIEAFYKEGFDEIKTEKGVRHFLEIQDALLKGVMSNSHISQVMTIIGLLTFKKEADKTVKELGDVSKMSQSDLVKALPNAPSIKVSMIAKWLMKKQRFHTKGKRFHLWRYDPDIGIWIKDGEDFIRKIVTDMTGTDYKSHICNETYNMIRSTSYNKNVELRGPEDIIVLSDGRLNLATGEHLDGFDCEEYQIVKIPVEYDSDADCPTFKKFLSEVLDNDEDVRAIFELIGYCLWKFMAYDMLIIFIGAGANGKTVLLEVMTKFLGEENISTVTLQQLAINRFASAGLMGKLANLAGEIPNEAIKDTSRVKDLSGGGLIEGEFKFQDTFRFYNFAKLIFSANEPPAIYDDVTGTWRRLRIFKFLKTFRKGAKGTIPRDILVSSLTTPTELSGILNEALAGWSRLRKYGKMTGDVDWEIERLEYIRVSNPIQYMTEKFFSPNHEIGWIPKSSFYELYLKYCTSEKIKAVGVGWFHKQFKRYAPFVTEGHPRSSGERVRAYSGVDIDQVGLRKIGVKLDNIQFELVDSSQIGLDEFGFEGGTGGTTGTGSPTPSFTNTTVRDNEKHSTIQGVGTPVPPVPPVPVKKTKKNLQILKRLFKLWDRNKKQYKDGLKPKDEKSITLLLNGIDAGYVREDVASGFWWFTDLAKEEIDK